MGSLCAISYNTGKDTFTVGFVVRTGIKRKRSEVFATIGSSSLSFPTWWDLGRRMRKHKPVNVWKSLYLNCGEWYEDIDHRSYTKLSSCKIKAWKKKSGLNGIRSIQPLKWTPNRPWNDPNFLLVDSEIIPKESENDGETWDCGLLSCSLLKCCNPVISFHSYEVSN